jgi:hypothetical protein
MAEELDALHTDDRGRVALLLLAQRSAPLRFDGVDTGLAARREAVRDVLALTRPTCNGCGRAVLEVYAREHAPLVGNAVTRIDL